MARPVLRFRERELAAAISIPFTPIKRSRAAHWIKALPVARMAVRRTTPTASKVLVCGPASYETQLVR